MGDGNMTTAELWRLLRENDELRQENETLKKKIAHLTTQVDELQVANKWMYDTMADALDRVEEIEQRMRSIVIRG